MRLIDADALKTPIEDRIDNIPASEYDNGWNNAIYAVIDEIDNAPTVEYTFEESFQKTVCEQRLYCPERPQGKWVKITKDGVMPIEYICNVCGRTVKSYYEEYLIEKVYPFCHCGAKMKGCAE